MELADETFYDRRESSLDIKIENQQVRPTPDGYALEAASRDHPLSGSLKNKHIKGEPPKRRYIPVDCGPRRMATDHVALTIHQICVQG